MKPETAKKTQAAPETIQVWKALPDQGSVYTIQVWKSLPAQGLRPKPDK